jgi:beta-glucosidase
MKKIIPFLTALVILTSCSSKEQGSSDLERTIDKELKSMTLDQKLGQMIQLEIGMFAKSIRIPSAEELKQMSQEEIAAFAVAYMESAKKPFELDEVQLDSAFSHYAIGSVLNVPAGKAQTPQVWNSIINTIQAKALETEGIPMVYGLDQVHGGTYSAGGTMFPSPINMAATFNRDLAFKMGEITAYETRACGVPWVFGPGVDLSRHQAWSRQYESYGEDVLLDSEMGIAVVKGLQGEDPDHIDKYHVGATLKHFFAYGTPDNGLDRTPAILSIQELKGKHFEPFRRGFTEGKALATMTNSSIVNNMNGVANREFLTEWLKKGLDWDGMIVTDWADLENLRVRDRIAATKKEAIRLGINAGVDMIMVPSEFSYGPLLRELVDEGSIPVSRIDDAVRRILRFKHRLGLYETPTTDIADYPLYGSEEFADYSRQAAIESEVLLKNDGVLPLSEGTRILVCGPNADSMRSLNGGWSYTWMGDGADSEEYTGKYNTILKALQNRFGRNNIVYEPGIRYEGRNWKDESALELSPVLNAARGCDVIIACVGENSYAETSGNIPDLTLSEQQIRLVEALEKTGKPVILVLNEGRGRIVTGIARGTAAVVHTMLPGNYGGDALASLLSGDENFSGRLPYTYLAYPNAKVNYDYRACEERAVMSGVYDYDAKTYQLWWFGEGLSYTEFTYSDLTVDKTSFCAGDTLNVSVTVTNTGSRDGKEVILLYSSDLYSSLMPENKRLRAFDKIMLRSGESQTVRFAIPANDLAFVDSDGHWKLEEGDFVLKVSDRSVTVHCEKTSVLD